MIHMVACRHIDQQHIRSAPVQPFSGAGTRGCGRLPVVMLAAGLLLSGCGSDAAVTYRFSRFAMDTVVEYSIVSDSPTAARDAMIAAHAEIERVAALLWEDEPESEVFGALHRGTEVSSETCAFLARARGYAGLTDGAFDPTIKPVLDLYGFSDEAPRPPSDTSVVAALEAVGMHRVRVCEGSNRIETASSQVGLAVGGIAKGYAVDRAVAVLREYGIRSALVNAGGDLYAMGTRRGKPWRVGIRDPRDPQGVLAVIEVTDQAVATSGDYERFFLADGVRYHHLLNPSDGRPVRNTRSATVLAATTEQADALATGFFVMGAASAVSAADALADVETLIADGDGLHTSRGMALP